MKWTEMTEYRVWQGMRERCNNPNDEAYPRYGGRGIKVCERWQYFTNFLADMGPRPDISYTIERGNNDVGYEPGNCRWIPRVQQSRNMRNNVWVNYNGERVLLMDLAEMLSLDRNVLYQRLKIGWTLEEAIKLPLNKKRRRPKPKVRKKKLQRQKLPKLPIRE